MAAIVYDKDAALRQGILGAGSVLSQAIGTVSQQKKEEARRQSMMNQQSAQTREYGSILQNTIGNLGENPSSMDVVRAYTTAISQGLPLEVAQGMTSLQKSLSQGQQAGGLGFESRDQLTDLLGRFGMGDEQAQREADLYLSLPTGGKTQYANFLFDRMQRGQLSSPNQSQITEESNVGVAVENGPSIDVADVSETEVERFQFPKVDIFQGLNNKEKASREKDLFNANAKEFAEIRTKSRGYEDELRRLGQMSRLNDSGKLPQGLENLNINWVTGDIRIPKLANAETQLFVKSVNDFTTKAKDTYGSRVTNFELGTFMRRLPTLANTEEGRRMILEQMKVNASLDKLYYDSLKEVYDNYGLRGIDTQKADKIAEDLRKEDEKALLKEYEKVLQAQESYEAKQNSPEGRYPVRSPEGKIGYVTIDMIDEAIKKGFEAL